MARSRYAGNDMIDGSSFGTWRNPVAEDTLGPGLIEGLQVVEHYVSDGDRVDLLAARYYGDSEYYWVICVANEILFPLSIQPGDRLLIPTDLRAALAKLQR